MHISKKNQSPIVLDTASHRRARQSSSADSDSHCVFQASESQVETQNVAIPCACPQTHLICYQWWLLLGQWELPLSRIVPPTAPGARRILTTLSSSFTSHGPLPPKWGKFPSQLSASRQLHLSPHTNNLHFIIFPVHIFHGPNSLSAELRKVSLRDKQIPHWEITHIPCNSPI